MIYAGAQVEKIEKCVFTPLLRFIPGSEPCAGGARGGKQQAGLAASDAGHQADAAQHGVEIAECGGVELYDQVPAAVGGVDFGYFREAAEGADDAVRHMAFNLDHHNAADRRFHRVGPQNDGVADDGAVIFHSFDAGANRRARGFRLQSQIGNAASAVVTQKGDEPFVEIIHDYHFDKVILPD